MSPEKPPGLGTRKSLSLLLAYRSAVPTTTTGYLPLIPDALAGIFVSLGGPAVWSPSGYLHRLGVRAESPGTF
ncbi:hypothetical protein TNCV_4412801 [Trichonephila clavipes]|nr:hypothetical protein TNCV_4412801 [Trichonephila clavipes]